jgi:hypothetical protein
MKKKKTSGVNIYLGTHEEKARRLAALQQLAENLGVKSIHKNGNLHSPLLCMLADLDIERLTQAVRLVKKA